ncbi:NAD(P)-binding domain-containing protein [[Actinomadura] parvosata]|uniref:NAD(P)-binding domain-containing protein n=1 Tax=[Actinomadura] parvosata TaxID=1955412 RepID=UPI001E38B812|nr:NAD(P)-binding domain-containing protein [Nonomuraea sp. ATCC 55076]
MGSAIAGTFVERGHRTTVWNRTAGRSAPLVDLGATAAATAAEAVAAGPLVVVCPASATTARTPASPARWPHIRRC